MNTSKRFVLAIFTAAAAVAAQGGGRPIALVGDGGEALTIRADVTDILPMKTEFKEREWIAPKDWKRYAAVVLCDDVERRLGAKANLDDPFVRDAAEKYV